MPKMRLATAIAKFLEDAGTEYVFGFNGHGNWALLDAFIHETAIKGVAVRSEDHAAHMADGYWRMRRRPPLAVVCTTVGPGNTNIQSALANAFFESSAMLVLAGAGPTQWYERGGIEEFYRSGPEEWTLSVKPIVKKAVLVNRPDTALEMVARAYKTAVSDRPGPVVVQLPFDVQHAEVDVRDGIDPRKWLAVSPPGPDLAAIETAADLIAAAERPLLVVGSGVHNARAWTALRELVERCELPVETTPMGKGSLPEDHPLCLGCVGRAGTGHANRAAKACDVLVGIGTRFGDFDTGGWTLHDIPGATKLIHIDIDSSELARVYPTDVAIVADARLALEALVQALGRRPVRSRQAWFDRIAEWKRAWEAEVAPIVGSDLVPLHYGRLFRDAAEVIQEVDPQTSILYDTGHALSFGPPFLTATSPFVAHCGVFHRMGWSAPAALGARLANPDHPAIAFIGDGSFMMTGTCLATAVEYEIPLALVVLNNRSLQIEREAMTRFYGRHTFCDYTLKATGEPWNPDFVRWAQAMGADARRITRPPQIKPAIREALRAGRPFVVDAAINVEAPGYRAIWYPYPSDFAARGVPNPAL